MKRIVYAANPTAARDLVVIENPTPAKGRAKKRTGTAAGSRTSTHTKPCCHMATKRKTSRRSTSTRSKSTRGRSTSKRSTSTRKRRQNPAAAISSQAVSTAKEAGAIILGSAAADQGVALLNTQLLGKAPGSVRAAAAVGVPGALGLMLMSGRRRSKAVKNIGLGMAITAVKNGIAVGLGAVSGAVSAVRPTNAVSGAPRSFAPSLGAGRSLGCGCGPVYAQPVTEARLLPAPAPAQLAPAARGNSVATLPASFAVIN